MRRNSKNVTKVLGDFGVAIFERRAIYFAARGPGFTIVGMAHFNSMLDGVVRKLENESKA
jgi:hypothetical protein